MSKTMIEYIKEIEALDFFPLRDNLDIWIDLENEGVFQEYEEGNYVDNWVYGNLKLSDEHRLGLIESESDTINFFNDLDFEIKEIFGMKVIDFINYNTGEVVILKYLK